MNRILMLATGLAFMLAVTPAARAADNADQKFVKEAIEGNYAEVDMGKLGQSNGQSEAVKSFGQMLVTDHGAANEKATKLAGTVSVTPPTGPNAKQMKMHDKMAKLSGAKFDKAYTKEMVSDHKKDIKAYEKAAKSKNADVSAYANETLPTLRKHLDTAQSAEKAAKTAKTASN